MGCMHVVISARPCGVLGIDSVYMNNHYSMGALLYTLTSHIVDGTVTLSACVEHNQISCHAPSSIVHALQVILRCMVFMQSLPFTELVRFKSVV